MKQTMAKDNLSMTPLELVNIFYEEASKIADNDDEAMRLTSDAVSDFLSHYKVTATPGT